jgi:hypothetical protein
MALVIWAASAVALLLVDIPAACGAPIVVPPTKDLPAEDGVYTGPRNPSPDASICRLCRLIFSFVLLTVGDGSGQTACNMH